MGFYDAIRIGASGAADSGYTIDRSLRFNPSDSPNLARTFGTSTNVRKRTISLWVKRAKINDSGGQVFFEYSSGGSGGSILFAGAGTGIGNNDEIHISNRNATSGSGDYYLRTNRLFRDPNAWYHLVLQYDTTQSTASDRIKLYVNGVQETSFASASYPSQNYDSTALLAGTASAHNIGYGIATGAANYFGGYIAEFNFIDGEALTPASFGETNAETGQWNPIKYTGSYGNQGFYLNFSDNSGTTATTLGKDSSGNGNNFTPSNFSVAAGAGNDSVEDTPTNNFCTLNPLDSNSNITLSNGNLVAAISSGFRLQRSTFFLSSGKWYWEITCDDVFPAGFVGVTDATDATVSQGGASSTSCMIRTTNGDKRIGGSETSYGSAVADGDVMIFALDMDNGKFWAGKNGTFFNSGNPTTGANPATSALTNPVTPSIGMYDNEDYTANFGQQGFTYTPPTDFKALNSANLPDPTILLPNKHFDTLIYTGDGGTQNITGLEYQPDWVWIKRRNAAVSSRLIDSVRGSDKQLISNLTDSEQTSNYFQSFNSDGFTLTGNHTPFNRSGGTYVAWNWNAGDTDGKTYTVKVVSDGGNKYRFDDFGTSAVTLDLAEGGTYIFDGSDSSMASHPIKLSETSNGTHGGGSSYNTGVTYLLDGASVTESAYVSGYASATTRQLKIVVAASAPTLYYYCHYHSGMGGQANTNSTLGSSNFDGAIQSTVKVNASAGFSIVKYTGTGSSTNIGHGLGVTPDVLIVKNREDSNGWNVYHIGLGGNTPAQNFVISLNSTAARTDQTSNWNDTAPTSSVFTVGTSNGSNGSNDDMIAYCFSEVAGYSKFGSYTGNGSSDGTFVFTGFRPAWILIKGTSGSRHWIMKDNKRNTFNVVNGTLLANSSTSEDTSSSFDIDFLSNGFKGKTSGSHVNASGVTYIFLAFAESPFKNARAR